jgi:hypothetical protein
MNIQHNSPISLGTIEEELFPYPFVDTENK